MAIRWIENKLNSYLNKVLKTQNKDYVIASDTDSIYLVLDELVTRSFKQEITSGDVKQVITFMDKVCENILQPFIDKSYNELAGYTNAYAQKMIMKREVLADKGIWTAKKHYIINMHDQEGVQYKIPKIKVMGLSMVKSSTPAACRVKLKEALKVILNNSESDVIEFIEDFRQEFNKLPLSDIAFPRGVNGISKYTTNGTDIYGKGTPIHVRGSILFNMFLKNKKLEKKYPVINEGDKIKFAYLKEPNPIRSNIISFQQSLPEEFGLSKYIDYNTQFEKSFLEPIKTILNCIGWKTEHSVNLTAFFD